jgi:chorismate mutase/prephenate dehydratase
VEDPVVDRLRERIEDVDRRIVAAVNERLELVDELWRHKRAKRLPLVVPDREQQLLASLARVNDGPLSDDGLRALYTEILALTKRELEA